MYCISLQFTKSAIAHCPFSCISNCMNRGFLNPVVFLCLDMHGTDGAPCIPDGLAQFRMNLEELLVDICLLLGAPAYINKVCVY